MTHRQFQRFITVILLLATIVAAADLVYLTSVDKRFLRCAERGLLAGWEQSAPESTLRDLDQKSDTAFIDAEHAAVAYFLGKKFKDESLGSLATDYINALNECSKVKAKSDPNKNFNKFWKNFSEPYGRRIRAIYALEKGDYRFLLELPDKYRKDNDELMLQGWALNKTAEIVFDRGKDSDNELVAEVVNDSGYDLEYIDLTVDLYNKKGKYIETLSVYRSGIKKDETIKLHCYESEAGKTREFVVTAIDCERAD